MRLFLCLLSFFYLHITVAQLSYTADQHYAVGAVVEYEVTNLVNPDLDFSTTGENIDWEYLGFSQTRKDTIEFIEPDDSGYKTSFCLSNFYVFNCNSKFEEVTNVAVKGADTLGFGEIKAENIVRHYLKNVDTYSETMLGLTVVVNGISVPVGIEYEKADTHLTFPLALGKVDSSESRLVIDLEPVGVNARIARNGKRINRVDGAGTLRTPAGIYNNVIKMKTLIFNTDTTSYDSSNFPISTTMVEYKWYAEGFSGPVLEASGLILGETEVISEVRYQKNADVSSLSSVDLKSDIFLFPNPFNDQLNISSEELEVDEIRIYNILGQCVFSLKPENKNIKIQPKLMSGHYFLVIFSDGDRVAARKITSL